MNNEQNNTFGIPNQVQPNNQNIPESTVIPGANLTPIGANTNMGMEQPNTNVTFNNIGTQPIQEQPTAPEASGTLTPNPIPGIVTGPSPINPPNIPSTPINTLPNENLNQTNNDTVVPGIVNQTSELNLNTPTEMGLNSTQSLNSGSMPVEQTTLTPNIPIDQNNMFSSTTNQFNNNLGDATPLSNEGSSNNNSDTVSVMKYLGHMILFAIPMVGFIMLLVKAFGGEKNQNIKNYAKAQLLLCAISVVITIISFIVFWGTIIAAFGNAASSSSSSDYNDSYDYSDYSSYSDYDYDY